MPDTYLGGAQSHLHRLAGACPANARLGQEEVRGAYVQRRACGDREGECAVTEWSDERRANLPSIPILSARVKGRAGDSGTCWRRYKITS